MTNKEAARTILYDIARDVSVDRCLDALCLAICALMREEEAGKSKHDKIEWHVAKTDPPERTGIYCAIRAGEPTAMYILHYINGDWYLDGSQEKILDVVEWSHYSSSFDV